jgi:hypothetical protein
MRPYSLILAYHGCDHDLADKILLGRETVSISDNDYDWLGTGAYFWENDPKRALQWAEGIKAYPQHGKHKIQKPAVIGAIINPGNCLDLTDTESLRLVKETYEVHKLVQEYSEEKPLPENEKGFSGDEDLVKRHLDCAVINLLHEVRKRSSEKEVAPFDSVRGTFVEGPELYPGAKIMSRTHIQICVRDPKRSVIGYFLPRLM